MSEVQALIELGLRELVRQRKLRELVDSFGTYDLTMTEGDLFHLRRQDLAGLGLDER